MSEIKGFITEYLKQSGAEEEILTKFNDLYDNHIQEGMRRETEGTLYQTREEQSQRQKVIADAAAKHNLRGSGKNTGGSIQEMAARHNLRNK